MAAPTNVRVEALSMSSVILRWTDGGTVPLQIHRSTDGSSYSEVTDENTRVLVGVEEYTDIGLSSGTKYWYKITDDNGSSFSSAATVYTHFCADQNNAQAFSLPRFDQGQDDQANKLNEMAERVERALGDAVISPETCVVCPDAGNIVIDCTDGCNSFLVIADQNINSFTINRCGNSDPVVDIYIPPATTRQICGFPAGYGFGGDECTEAPIAGGTNGRTIRFGGGGAGGGGGLGGAGSSSPGLPKSVRTAGGGSGGGVGGTDCECVPGQSNQLTLKCCTNECSLSCSSTKKLVIKVCGGIGPYTFSHSGSIKFQTDNAGTTADTVVTDVKNRRPQVTVVPPTNSGSAVAGSAYAISKRYCYWFGAGAGNCGPGGGSSRLNGYSWTEYGCDDAVEVACQSTDDNGLNYANCTAGRPATIPCASGTCGSTCLTGCGSTYAAFTADGTACSNMVGGVMCDKRSAGMISNNCSPCGLNDGATVTVTDAAGVSVSITIKA